MELLEGTVVKSTGSWYRILLDNGNTVDARAKGKLRLDGKRSTNPVAVGDRVKVAETNGEYNVEALLDRKNYIIRKSTNLSHQTHVIAANVDLAVVVVTLKQPKIKFGFIDRFLVTAEAYSIPAMIVFNKVDLCSQKELEYLEHLQAAFKDIGYASHLTSVVKGSGVEAFKSLIKGQTVLVAGHSGVGKSSLLNALNPALELRTTSISDYNNKGTHTTTFAEMHPIDATTMVIDSPGLKNFGLIDMEPEDLKDYFPEMVRHGSDCKFHNCLHINEPNCQVRAMFEAGELPFFRYENYLTLYEEVKQAVKE